jgi:hypothetical protein
MLFDFRKIGVVYICQQMGIADVLADKSVQIFFQSALKS